MTTYNDQTFIGPDAVQAGYNTYNNCTFTDAPIILGEKTAYFNGGSMTGCTIAGSVPITIAGKTVFQNMALTRCDIDVTFKVFYGCTMHTCYLMDGSLYGNPGASIYDRGFGTELQSCSLTDTVLSSHAPFWLYNSSNNNFYGTLRSMPMYYNGTVVKSWSELRSGAAIYGSTNSTNNTFYAVDGLELLGSGLLYSHLYQGNNARLHTPVARDAKLGFSVLSNDGTASLTDSVLSFVEVSGGPLKIAGSRTIADGSDWVCPTEICEYSSLADTNMQYGAVGPGSFRGTSFRGASFTDMVFANMYTSNTVVTGASGTSCLDSTGTVTTGTYTRGANNLGSMGVLRIDNPTTTLRTTPVLAPGTAYLMAVALGNSTRYNYVVETGLVGTISAYILSYGAVMKAGITSSLMTMTDALLEGVKSVAALTGDQLQDVYARVESTTAYILVVNNSATESLTLGVSGRTGVIRATGLSASTQYGLVDMTTVPGIMSTQDTGTLHYNISFDGNALMARGHQFASGFGSHANATVTVPTVANVVGTFAGYAHDDEIRFNRPVDCGTSNLSIKSGSTTYASTTTINAWNGAQWVYAHHGIVPSVTLKATAPGGITYAHADILYPTFIVDAHTGPFYASLSNSSIVGGLPIGTTVGTLSTLDFTEGSTFVYTMASGAGDTDNGSFSISGALLLSATVFPVDVSETRSVRIRTTDNGGLWHEVVLTINVLTAVIDTDGIVYPTVKIGSQTWTAENSRKASGTYWYSNNDSSTLLTKGRLYDFASAQANAPTGYHLPTDDDWKTLELSIGMSAGEVASSGLRGNKGVTLKANSALWTSSNNGTNLYGFSALPAGLQSGGFWNYNDYAMFWAAMPGDASGCRWIPGEPGNDVGINRVLSRSSSEGYSVRYVKDA